MCTGDSMVRSTVLVDIFHEQKVHTILRSRLKSKKITRTKQLQEDDMYHEVYQEDDSKRDRLLLMRELHKTHNSCMQKIILNVMLKPKGAI